MKKVLSILMCLCMVVSTFLFVQTSASAETSGDYEYHYNNLENDISIFNYNGSATTLEIPITLDGYKVTGIDGHSFFDCTSLTSVTIPDSIAYIGKYAFGYYSSPKPMGPFDYLKIDNFTIKGYTNSAAERYANENNFNFISIGETSPYICKFNDEVKNCTITNYNGSASTIKIPSIIDGYAVTSIGDMAFYGCTSLTEITIPDSVTNIGDEAFGYYGDWNNIQKVDGFTIKGYTNSVAEKYAKENDFKFISIGETSLFLYELNWGSETCTIKQYNGSASTIKIPSIIDGYAVTNIGDMAFYGCTSLTEITIPDSVTWIGNNAFKNCTSLMKATIPDSVTNIGDEAFGYYGDWNNIQKIDGFTINGYTDSLAERYAKENKFNFVSIGKTSPYIWEFKEGDDSDSIYIDQYTGSATTLEIPSEIEEHKISGINSKAFYNCTSLKIVSIPESVTWIGDKAFGYYGDDNTNAQKVNNFTIKGYTNSIAEKYAKENNFNFVSIGETSPYICKFDDKSKNCEITKYTGADTILEIPNQIGEYTVTIIANLAFNDCTLLTNVTIPNGIIKIGNSAFINCTSLTNIAIPNSVTSIGSEAFENCASLTSVTIGNSVTSIGEYAFYDCASLTSVTIPDSVTSIGEYTFNGCTSLTSITIPNSVVNIGEYAFDDCTLLKSITIPDSVTSIGNRAFGYYYDDNDEYAKIPNFTIKGYKNSEAEKYAKDNGFNFIALDKTTDSTQPTTQPTVNSNNKTTQDTPKTTTVAKNTLKTPKLKFTSGKKIIKIKYAKVKNAVGFQVRYKVKGKWVYKTFNTKKSATKTITGLKKGKYKVQIRTFSKGKKSYSSWSKTKTIKVK